MALQQAINTNFQVSAGVPATHDQAGMEALSYTTVGFLNSLPDTDGETDIATFDDLFLGTETKLPDMRRAGNGVLSVGLDDSDVGQVILETAKDASGASASVVCKFVLPDATVYYRRAIVTSYKPTGIEVGNIIMADVGLEFYNTTVKV